MKMCYFIDRLIHTCQPPEYKNLETSRNLCIVRMSLPTMSEYSPKITRRPCECSRRLSVRTSFTYRIAIVLIIFNVKLLSDSKV